MDSLCKKFNLPNDIRIMIEEINHKKNTKDLINEFNNIYATYWRERFRNYEITYLLFLNFTYNNTINNRKKIYKFERDKNLFKIDNNKYNMIYNDHINIFDNIYQYISYYFEFIINIDNNGKFKIK
jgi:hypothetical protein